MKGRKEIQNWAGQQLLVNLGRSLSCLRGLISPLRAGLYLILQINQLTTP